MQTAAADSDNQDPKLKGRDDSINFRPSPNFKHMKKYLKSKFEEENNLICASKASESQSPTADGVEKGNSPTVPIQPPLPPNPPPPDSPINTVTVKEEIMDVDEPQSTDTMYSAEKQGEGYPLVTDFKLDNSETEKEETMCRNFIRGTCTKGKSCIFVHKVIVSQLSSVYKFCNDFQNSVCNYRKCKFVHATVFEKEYFFRTGYLPRHTLAHLNEVKQITQPQPPPPPPPMEEIQTAPIAVAPVYTEPQHPPMYSVAPVPVMNYAPPANLDPGPVPVATNAFPPDQPRAVSPQKREWSNIDSGDNGDQSDDDEDTPPKKCKSCDINEFRMQYAKLKLENVIRASEEIDKKLSLLDNKSKKLCTVLAILIKPVRTVETVENMDFVNLLAKFLIANENGGDDSS